ncbi:MAG: ribosomal RNA small subunit methyltransferase A [Chloroflexi bacterium]|nr:MAG: ribosomal RNA small subunit methyltransferase A [Chloroflexota bacterium]
MDQSSTQSISAILKNHNLRPDKSLGQNFLTDPNILDQIVRIAGVTATDTVLEIGAGLGHLTAQLARSARAVTAVELDGRFIPILSERLAPYANITLVEGDILQLNNADLIQVDDYLVVANIPYYITSRILRKLLEAKLKPREIILTIQYEVARRVCAESGKLSLLALSVQMYGKPRLVMRIPAGAFYPPPKVDSAVIKIDLHPDPLLPDPQREIFFQLIKAGFLHKRKTLRNSISKGLGWSPDQAAELLLSGGIDPLRRAETLSIPEWLELTSVYEKVD